MNDRELIDNAARAAKNAGMCLLYGGSTDEAESYWHYDFRRWEPLDDDGDALRLAVKLNLRLECMTTQTAASTFDQKISVPVDHTIEKECARWPFEQCPYAATRRAIVRAAAAIGAAL